MKVVDSSGWLEYFTDGPLADAYSTYIEGTEEIFTPTIAIYEVYKKIYREADERSADMAVAHMKKTTVVALDEELAVAAAEYGVEHKLPMADAIVYATAQKHAAIVVTSDAHFAGLPDVEFIPKLTAGYQ